MLIYHVGTLNPFITEIWIHFFLKKRKTVTTWRKLEWIGEDEKHFWWNFYDNRKVKKLLYFVCDFVTTISHENLFLRLSKDEFLKFLRMRYSIQQFTSKDFLNISTGTLEKHLNIIIKIIIFHIHTFINDTYECIWSYCRGWSRKSFSLIFLPT